MAQGPESCEIGWWVECKGYQKVHLNLLDEEGDAKWGWEEKDCGLERAEWIWDDGDGERIGITSKR